MGSSRSSRPSDLPDVVASALAPHVQPGQHLAVALSGGIDSVVLLHLLSRLRPRLGFSLSALHVNHGLSPNADRWQDFCETLCDGLAVPLACRRVSVARAQSGGLEAAARAARYREFEQAHCDWLVLAHQRDDQAETVLHNLLRGAGVRGAAAMPRARSLGPGRPGLLRPLLPASRARIEDYARAHGLSWIEDESNRDAAYARNFLRHEILPRLSARFPGADAALARAAQRFGEAEALLEEVGAADLAQARRGEALRVESLRALMPARAANLLRCWLRQCGAPMPDAVATGEVLRQVLSAAPDRRVRIAIGRRSVRRFAGALHLVAEDAPLAPSELAWSGEAELAWGEARLVFAPAVGQGIAAAALRRAPVVARRRRGGEAMRLSPNGPRRTLKNLFQEHAVPPWRREAMPLLWCGGDLVWVPQVGIAADYRCAAGEPGWLVTWQSG